MMQGYIHSLETMGLHDGPGIRVVVFMQGCPLRCLFCHNPDTWTKTSKLKMTSDELVDQVRKYRSYIEENGGITLSGGEPLFQSEFVLEVFKKCKLAGINTCLDTAGTGYNKKYLKEILKYTDLVMLDIKALNNEAYKKMTGKSIEEFEYFVKVLNESNKKVWIRQVIVPTINDTEEYIKDLKKYISKIKNIEKVELLPYHTMGVDKYKKLNIKYRLENVPEMDKEECERLNSLL